MSLENVTLEEEWISQIDAGSTLKHYVKGMSYFKEFLARAELREWFNKTHEPKPNDFFDIISC